MIIHHEAVKQEASDFSWDVSFLRLRDMQFIKGNGNWRMEQQLTVFSCAYRSEERTRALDARS
jgi:hypothetical protein